MTKLSPRTPVLVGIGAVTQREEDPARALEPVALMIEAARQAGASAGSPDLLKSVERIYVPKGRWDYGNPAGLIANALGASRAATVLAKVGVLQQGLIGDACARIAEGEVDVALVAGGEAGYRLLRQKITGVSAPDLTDEGEPDALMSPKSELRHPAELAAGLQMPVGLYAMIETAYRAVQGMTLQARMDQIGRLYSRFSEIAADNPGAWERKAFEPQDLQVGPRNPMQAFPYTKRHCSSWSVDQASALLFCSLEKAQALGLPEAGWIYPLVSSESNSMTPVSARVRVDECPGARIAGLAALDHAGIAAADLDLVELYSCFPIAVDTYATALGLSSERDLTVTGGMPFSGGPYNNYVLQSTARMAELLRQGRGRTGLVSSVSGVLTKQGFGVWSTRPGERPYRSIDVTDQVEAQCRRLDVVTDYTGDGRIVSYTVTYDRERPPRGVVIVDTAGGQRTVGRSDDAAVVAQLEAGELHGRPVRLSQAVFDFQ